MRKFAKRIDYGTPQAGQGYFDDETDVPIIKDPDTGEDYASIFMSGVRNAVTPEGATTNLSTKTFSERYMPYVSEFASNALGHDKEALKAYLIRYARTLEAYKKIHGHYPKQRIIGHSRGGGGALEFMEALAKEYPKLPRVDEYVGLDPYDTPFSRDKDTKRSDGRYVAKRSVIVRPKRSGPIIVDQTDMDGDGMISRNEKIYPHLSNLLVMFARRMNPFSRKKTIDVAVPGTHHSSAAEMMDAYLAIRAAKSQREALKALKAKYGIEDSAMLATQQSPTYGDTHKPFYEKAASING